MSQPSQPSQPSSFGSNLYSGAATVGRVGSTISLYIFSIIGIIFIIGGCYLLYEYYNNNDKHTDEVSAKIISISLPTCANKDFNLIGCSVDLNYNYKGKDYTVNNFLYKFNKTIDPNSMVGKTISVYVNPSNPTDISENNAKTDKVFGIVCIVIGIILPAFAYLNWWLTRKYKAFAAVEGVETGIGVMRHIL